MTDNQSAQKTDEPSRKKKHRAITFITFAQSVFLTAKFYFQNRLISYAASCAFSFLFSFIPVFIMIGTIFIKILHGSPELMYRFFEETGTQVESAFFNIGAAIESIQNLRLISAVDVVLIVFLIWMARGLFASIFRALQCIFHTHEERKAWWTQILTFIIEVTIVVTIAAVMVLLTFTSTILNFDVLKPLSELFSEIQAFLHNTLMNYLPSLLLFLLITTLYKIAAGTKPPLSLCLLSALLCTLSFSVFHFLIHLFLDYSRYNLIYGVLAQLIIAMLDIYFFFIFFMIFAQFVFVVQFFDELLLGELYLLPKKDTGKLGALIRRTLFIRPDFLLAQDSHRIHLKEGELVYSLDERSTDAYYIVKGQVKESRGEVTSVHHRGDFFGEIECILRTKRDSVAVCAGDVELVRINGATFRLLTAQNEKVALKALGQISSYFTELYGRTDAFLL